MTKPYGCHNQPRLDWYWVQDAWCFTGNNERVTIMRKHDDTSSRECHYDQRVGDSKCEGCGK